MAAPTSAVQKLKKILANTGPSTHGLNCQSRTGPSLMAGKFALFKISFLEILLLENSRYGNCPAVDEHA
jgi:hypothetical protein